MAEYHTVEQGEHLSLIAKNYGFASYATIWNHDNNADLRELRKNPNVLRPGDKVFVPDKQAKHAEIKTGERTRFRVQSAKVMLRLVLENPDGSPMANTECELRIDGQAFPVTTDGDGLLEQEIPATARDASLAFKETEVPFELEMPLKIGHMDPVDEVTGQVARLNNLGYLAGPLDPVDERLFVSAVEEFQCDEGLTIDGKCGPQTQKKLAEVHGC